MAQHAFIIWLKNPRILLSLIQWRINQKFTLIFFLFFFFISEQIYFGGRRFDKSWVQNYSDQNSSTMFWTPSRSGDKMMKILLNNFLTCHIKKTHGRLGWRDSSVYVRSHTSEGGSLVLPLVSLKLLRYWLHDNDLTNWFEMKMYSSFIENFNDYIWFLNRLIIGRSTLISFGQIEEHQFHVFILMFISNEYFGLKRCM